MNVWSFACGALVGHFSATMLHTSQYHATAPSLPFVPNCCDFYRFRVDLCPGSLGLLERSFPASRRSGSRQAGSLRAPMRQRAGVCQSKCAPALLCARCFHESPLPHAGHQEKGHSMVLSQLVAYWPCEASFLQLECLLCLHKKSLFIVE